MDGDPRRPTRRQAARGCRRFMAFARQLRTPTLYKAIGHAERLGDVVRFGFSASVWRHFERLEAFPRGLLPFGDVICCFNPVYGQGMSVAAQEALLLRRLLGSRDGDPLGGLAPAFFAEACGLIETPWASAAVPDLAFPETKGQRPPDLDGMLKFGRALNRLAAADPAVHQQMIEVQHLIKPRIVLRDPIIPAPYLPEGWPGIAAREAAAAIWRALFRASEAWLDANAASAYGPLPPRSNPWQRF